MVFSGNRVTHAPHQTNCNFKAKAEKVKSYSNFQYKTIKAHQQAQKVTNPRDIFIYNNILRKINNALFFLNWRIFSRKVLYKG